MPAPPGPIPPIEPGPAPMPSAPPRPAATPLHQTLFLFFKHEYFLTLIF